MRPELSCAKFCTDSASQPASHSVKYVHHVQFVVTAGESYNREETTTDDNERLVTYSSEAFAVEAAAAAAPINDWMAPNGLLYSHWGVQHHK